MTKALVEVQGLERSFGRHGGLQPVSFELTGPCLFGVKGGAGSGKTTLVSILAGFLRSSAGQARILGHKPGASGLRGRVGALSQRARLPQDETVTEFLDHLARLQRVTRGGLRDVTELLELNDALPLRCEQLPLSIAKRVALAAALLGQPEILLLDEPTLGLPLKDAKLVRTVLRRASTRAAIVLVSGDPMALAECDQAIHLANARLGMGDDVTPQFDADENQVSNGRRPPSHTFSTGNYSS